MVNGSKEPEKIVTLQTPISAADRDRLRNIGRHVYGIRKVKDFVTFLVERELRQASTEAVTGNKGIEGKVNVAPLIKFK